MYRFLKWVNQVKDSVSGQIIQKGTPQSAGNFNNIENGLSDVHVASALTMVAMRQTTKAEKFTDQTAIENSGGIVTLSYFKKVPKTIMLIVNDVITGKGSMCGTLDEDGKGYTFYHDGETYTAKVLDMGTTHAVVQLYTPWTDGSTVWWTAYVE